jgi:AraC-like DNA-binding protein
VDGGNASRIHSLIEDSALGRWRMDVCRPQPALADLVSQLWFGEGQISYRRDRILPSGGSFLLINLGPTQYRIETGPPERRIAFDDIWLCGMHQTPIETEVPNGSILLGVAFHGHGVRPWLHMDAEHCADRVSPLSDLLGDGALKLRERLLECRLASQRFAMVEEWLLQRLRPGFETSGLARWALGEIETSRGRISIDALARQAGVSRRHLGLTLRRDVGLGSKSLARVHRFKSALQWLSGCERIPWSELAAHCGYYDQSHLIRDFQAFSGMSPGELVRCERPDAGSIVIAT